MNRLTKKQPLKYVAWRATKASRKRAPGILNLVQYYLYHSTYALQINGRIRAALEAGDKELYAQLRRQKCVLLFARRRFMKQAEIAQPHDQLTFQQDVHEDLLEWARTDESIRRSFHRM